MDTCGGKTMCSCVRQTDPLLISLMVGAPRYGISSTS